MMRVLWKLKYGRNTVLVPVIGVCIWLAFVLNILRIHASFEQFVPIFAFACAVAAILVFMIGSGTYEVALDKDDIIVFHRLFGTIKVRPQDLREIRLQYIGVMTGRIFVKTIHHKFYFWGSASLSPVMARLRNRTWDKSTIAGLAGMRLPTDIRLWDALIVMQDLNPQLKISDPYLQEQIAKRRDWSHTR